MKFLLSLIVILSVCMALPAYAQPSINDSDFVVQKYVSGICCAPTTMAFEGNDILVLEKISGEVHLIRNGIFQPEPVLKENVTADNDQGMLGIDAVGKKVYLYFTESSSDKNGTTLCNCVYSYDWDGQKLVNKTLVKTMPHFEIYHIGGVMTTDLNGSVYLVVGDNGRSEENVAGVLENNATGAPDDTGVIVRLVPPGPYYAIGIRNSFGLAVDPVTGNLWDTENGPDYGDEVNMVTPNFNSGWQVLTGPANKTQLAQIPHYKNYTYHDPQFTWMQPVAPTGIAFVNSPQFEKYKNSVFVGDCNNGNLYKFELNANRDGFVFKSPQLSGNVAQRNASMDEIVFGTGFGCMTDLVAGPDGLLYITSLSDGAIYRIVPKSIATENVEFGYLTQNSVYLLPVLAIGAASIVYIKSVRKKAKQAAPKF